MSQSGTEGDLFARSLELVNSTGPRGKEHFIEAFTQGIPIAQLFPEVATLLQSENALDQNGKITPEFTGAVIASYLPDLLAGAPSPEIRQDVIGGLNLMMAGKADYASGAAIHFINSLGLVDENGIPNQAAQIGWQQFLAAQGIPEITIEIKRQNE